MTFVFVCKISRLGWYISKLHLLILKSMRYCFHSVFLGYAESDLKSKKESKGKPSRISQSGMAMFVGFLNLSSNKKAWKIPSEPSPVTLIFAVSKVFNWNDMPHHVYLSNLPWSY